MERTNACWNEQPRPVRAMMRIAAALAWTIAFATGTFATVIPGGGPAKSDCYVVLDVEGTRALRSTRILECVDGDPSCDLDGLANDQCEFGVRVCVNQPGMPGCTPPSALETLRLSYRPRTVTLRRPAVLGGPVCSDTVRAGVAVIQRPNVHCTGAACSGRKRPGRARIVTSARAVRGTRPRFARHSYVLRCLPQVSPSPQPTESPCGHGGQRACCGITGEGPPCPRLTEVLGCSGDCRCGGLNPFGVNSISHCVAAGPCGRDGQRGCCAIQGEGQPCPGGLTEVNGCVGDCICGGESNPLGLRSNSTCIQATPCGAKGQRACCIGERSSRCDEGLFQVPGCSGDCTCGGAANPLQISSSGTCTVIESIAEPDPGWTPPAARPACALRGYADMHVHMFANLAHGGGVLAGEAYDATGGINAALAQDFGTNLDLVKSNGSPLPAPSCPPYLQGRCGSVLFHGDHTIFDDTVGIGTKDGTNAPLGAPSFNGWPRWSSTTHQQVYYRWLERAWRGGLRLISMLAVTNEALCKSSKHLRTADCDQSMLPPSAIGILDMFDERFRFKPEFRLHQVALPPIERQLQAAYEFEDYLDAQSGGPGQGWFRIVRTPEDARRAIAAGKLAVVLGIEVDNPFGCKFNGPCTTADVTTAVDKYYEKGVRHIFPVHNFDNGFGSPAAWQDAINVGNAVSEGRWWDAENCLAQGFGFWLDVVSQAFIDLLGFGGRQLPTLPLYPNGNLSPVASCNTKGLSTLGDFLIETLMNKGMIIDIDHMSNRSIDRTLTHAGARKYPVVASHVQFFDLYVQKFGDNAGRHERMRTLTQLEWIRSVGGMVAVMLKDDVQDTDRKGKNVTVSTYGGITNDCRHSSKSWAQAYKYAVSTMNGPVAFGSDFNGVAGHVGPRFGSDACGDGLLGGDLTERLTQRRAGNKVTYPFEIPDFGRFDKQVTGQKVFDFNGDGLAHIGLLPDLIADLRMIGLTDADLDPLFRSAEGFIQVWERSELKTPPRPCEVPPGTMGG
jgi:microsomal dipeptidase-like Zn-dependent dipeptidase